MTKLTMIINTITIITPTMEPAIAPTGALPLLPGSAETAIVNVRNGLYISTYV